jgi:hypothetical protein
MSTTTTTVTHPDGTAITTTTISASGAENGLKDGFEARLDAVVENMIKNEKCAIPGVPSCTLI